MAPFIRKAIFPVGGLGTRFLPATKAVPKEMLPVADKPLIQYAVEEARAAGIEQFIFIISYGKEVLIDHFDHAYQLENILESLGKTQELASITSSILSPGSIVSIRQQEPLGLGHAVWCARHLIHNEPFAVLLPDDLIHSPTPCLQQMVEAFHQVGGNIVAAMDVPVEHTHRYGILDIDHSVGQLIKAKSIIEKPSSNQAPSNTAVIGRYILQPEIFGHLENLSRGAGGEIQLTDALAALCGKSKSSPLYGYRFEGERYDCGTKEELLLANLALALNNPELAPKLIPLLQERLNICYDYVHQVANRV